MLLEEIDGADWADAAASSREAAMPEPDCRGRRGGEGTPSPTTGVANLASIMAAFRRAGAEPLLAADPEELAAPTSRWCRASAPSGARWPRSGPRAWTRRSRIA